MATDEKIQLIIQKIEKMKTKFLKVPESLIICSTSQDQCFFLRALDVNQPLEDFEVIVHLIYPKTIYPKEHKILNNMKIDKIKENVLKCILYPRPMYQ